MDDNQRNYTPIQLDGARPRGSFMTSSLKKNIMAVAGVLLVVVMVGIGAVSLQNRQTLTTPAQTTTPIACPEGYRLITASATNADDIQTQCPGGDIVVVDGAAKDASSLNTGTAATTVGGSTGDGVGSTVPGTSTGDGDSSTISTKIVCCRPRTETTPTTPETTPVDGEPTPVEACFIPKLEIINVKLECPNCDQ